MTEKSTVKYLMTVLSIICDRIIPISGPFGFNRNACDQNDPDPYQVPIWSETYAWGDLLFYYSYLYYSSLVNELYHIMNFYFTNLSFYFYCIQIDQMIHYPLLSISKYCSLFKLYFYTWISTVFFIYFFFYIFIVNSVQYISFIWMHIRFWSFCSKDNYDFIFPLLCLLYCFQPRAQWYIDVPNKILLKIFVSNFTCMTFIGTEPNWHNLVKF